MEIKVNVNLDDINPVLDKFVDTQNDRAKLNEYMGQEVQEVTRGHLAAFNAAHPNKLGGKRTNYWGYAGIEVGGDSALEVSKSRAFLNLKTPGLARAFHNVTILPGTKTPGAKFIPIPAGPEAYGFKPREFDNLVLFYTARSRAAGHAAGLATGEEVTRKRDSKNGKAGSTFIKPKVAMFWFTKQADQQQDRSILPSDKEWSEAAGRGARRYMDHILRGAAKDSKSGQ